MPEVPVIFGGSFGKNLDILKAGMDASLMRRAVIADNIANSDTPNFKRSTVTFEAQLERALDSERIISLPLLRTDPRHIDPHRPLDWRTVQPRKVLDYLTTAKNNGNNVDIEVEGVDALQNQLLYETMAQAISAEFARVNLVVR
jgi:flagellar basal-body rod protein FlgB